MRGDSNCGSRDSWTDRRIPRRKLLKSTALGTAGLLAGCLGDNSSANDGSPGGTQSELSFISGPSSSLAFGMGNAFSSVIQDDSELTLNIKSGPSGQSVALVGRGEADLGFSTTLVGIRAKNREGSFEQMQFDQTLLQLPSFYFMRLGGFVKSGSDIEYYSDLAGESLGPGPSGASYWDVWKLAIENALDIGDLEVQNSSVGQLSDFLSSDQARAVGGPVFSNNITPGFMQQVISGNDVRLISYREDALQAIQEDPKTPVAEVKKDSMPKVNGFTSEGDTVPMVSANYVLYSSDAVPTDAIYNMYKSAWDNRETLGDTHAAFKTWSTKEWFTRNMTAEIPVHPGAVKFLEELGVWSDEYTEGSV